MNRVTRARVHGWLVTGLVLVILLMAIGLLFKHQVVTVAGLSKNKDAIDVGSKIIGTFLLVVGAVASYFRFFRRRTLTPRLKLDVEIDVLPTDRDFNIHICRVVGLNCGSVPVWDPIPTAVVSYHGPDSMEDEYVDDWWAPMETETDEKRVAVIDTGEDEQFILRRSVPKRVWAVTYFFRVALASGYVWERSATASNLVKSESKHRGPPDK